MLYLLCIFRFLLFKRKAKTGRCIASRASITKTVAYNLRKMKKKLTYSYLQRYLFQTLAQPISYNVSAKLNSVPRSKSQLFRLIRPSLSVTRLDTLYICKGLKLPIYPDKSNRKTFFLRNRVRKQLLPAIRVLLNPQFDEILCNFSDSISL